MDVPHGADFGGKLAQQAEIRLDPGLDLHEVDAFQFDPVPEAVDRHGNIDGIASRCVIAIPISKGVAGDASVIAGIDIARWQ